MFGYVYYVSYPTYYARIRLTNRLRLVEPLTRN